MKIQASLISFIISISVCAQNGYVKLYNSDSVAKGYIRYYYPANGLRGIEIWRNKNDKHPLRFGMEMISEYSFKRDTFKVFRNYTPFQESKVYIDFAIAKVISRAKISLYEIKDFEKPNKNNITGFIPKVDDNFFVRDKLVPIYGNDTPLLYILEDRSNGYIKAISIQEDKMKQVLSEFLPEKYLIKYEEVKGKIRYKDIPDLVKLYNSK